MSASFAHPVTPTLFQGLNLGDYMFGYALAAQLTTNFLFSPFWGKLSTFVSSRVSLLISCAGYSLGQLFFALSQTEMQFLLARAFAGMFAGGSFVSILTYIVNTSTDSASRGKNLTLSATITSVAGAFGFFAGGMLGEMGIYVALGAQVLVLLLSGVCFFFICEKDAQIPFSELNIRRVAKEANPFAAFIAGGKYITLVFAFLLLSSTMHSLGQVSFDQSFNYYLKDVFGFSSGYNGAIKAAMGIITLAANSTVCIYLMTRTNIRKSTFGVFAMSTATMFSIVMTNKVMPFLALNVVFYAMSSVALPMLQNLAADAAVGKDSNLVMGLNNSVRSLGGIIGAATAGASYSVNPKLPFVFSLIAFGFGTVFSALYATKEKPPVIEEELVVAEPV